MVVVGGGGCVCGSRIHLNENFWGRKEEKEMKLKGKGKRTKNKKQKKNKNKTAKKRRLQIGRM